MMDFALSILALIAGGLVVELFTGARVKPAFQDEGGLQPAAARRDQAGNSPHSKRS